MNILRYVKLPQLPNGSRRSRMIRILANSTLPILLVASLLVTAIKAQQVEIVLRGPANTVYKNTVRISDVADLRDGNPALRQQLAALDLHEFDLAREPVEISSSQIRFRAILAGIDARQFSLRGTANTTVQFSNPIDATTAFQTAFLHQLAKQYQISEDSFELQWITAIDPIVQRLELDLPSLIVSPQFPPELPLGQRAIEVHLLDNRGQTHQVNLSVKISVYRELVMAKQNISRGEILDEEKIERVRRPIDSTQVRFASFDQTIGKAAQSDIQQFSLVKTQFVRDELPNNSPASNANTFDVKRNQRLNIVVRRGPLVITLQDAQAMENGRIGDYIDFQNQKSKQRLRARIIDPQTATLEM